MSLCVGVLNCVWSHVKVHFETHLFDCPACVFVHVCQTVSWGKIILFLLSGSPRGLLSCCALLESLQGEADMTAVLENEARRTITPSASIFVLLRDVSTSVFCTWSEGHMPHFLYSLMGSCQCCRHFCSLQFFFFCLFLYTYEDTGKILFRGQC